MRELISRDDLLEKKRDELNSIIMDTFDSIYIGDALYSTKLINDFYESGFINITAPQVEPQIIHMLRMDSLRNYKRGESVKLGNILLNFKKLMSSLPEIITATVSIAYDIPILKVIAALSIWKALKKIATVEITKSQAIVIYALWKNCNKEHKITIEQGFDNANNLIHRIDETKMNWDNYIEIVMELDALRCLEMDDAGIWLREWIREKYR